MVSVHVSQCIYSANADLREVGPLVSVHVSQCIYSTPMLTYVRLANCSVCIYLNAYTVRHEACSSE